MEAGSGSRWRIVFVSEQLSPSTHERVPRHRLDFDDALRVLRWARKHGAEHADAVAAFHRAGADGIDMHEALERVLTDRIDATREDHRSRRRP
jgi:hypothetical protein